MAMESEKSPMPPSQNTDPLEMESLEGARRASTPMLVGLDSVKLPMILTALHNTSTFRTLFSNGGENVMNYIEFEPHWWVDRRNPIPDNGLSDSDWATAVRIELQLINAFLSGCFLRLKCSTARIECLLNYKRTDRKQTEWSIYEVCDTLSKVPQFKSYFTQIAKGAHQSFNVMPMTVDLNYIGVRRTDLQNALDGMFWHSTMSPNDRFDVNEVPVLQSLNNVFIVCCSLDVRLRHEVWLERYTSTYKSYIDTYWHKKKDLLTRRESHKRNHKNILNYNNEPLIPNIEKSANELGKLAASITGNDSEEAETRRQLLEAEKELRLSISKLNEAASMEISSLKKVNEEIHTHSLTAVVPINPLLLTPWVIKAILWLDESHGPMGAYVQSDGSTWIITAGTVKECAEWEDIMNSVVTEGGYVAFYEREESYFKPEKRKKVDTNETDTKNSADNFTDKIVYEVKGVGMKEKKCLVMNETNVITPVTNMGWRLKPKKNEIPVIAPAIHSFIEMDDASYSNALYSEMHERQSQLREQALSNSLDTDVPSFNISNETLTTESNNQNHPVQPQLSHQFISQHSDSEDLLAQPSTLHSLTEQRTQQHIPETVPIDHTPRRHLNDQVASKEIGSPEKPIVDPPVKIETLDINDSHDMPKSSST